MKAFWRETACFDKFPTLKQDADTDVLIIGGGLAGILCAYMLKKHGVKYMLLEAGSICSSVSADTTAKITAQHGFIYDKLIKRFGVERTQMYLKANLAAVESYGKLCGKINCDFEDKAAFAYSLDDEAAIERELRALERLGYGADYVAELPLPFETEGAVRFKKQAQFNPMKFAAAISRGLNIYENSRVIEMRGLTAVTREAKVRSRNVIVATHFPFINKHGFYFLKMYQHRSYVLVLKNAQSVDGMYIDASEKGLSFRNYKDMLLLGGGSHRTGKRGGGFDELKERADFYYPDASEVRRWATQDCMTLDDVPYIGQYSKNTPNFYVATGFNKWGMTSSMVSASILTDIILGRKNEFAPVFSPSRSMMCPKLLLNALQAGAGWLTPTAKRCPHLGCALKWNSAEHTWDCPCHGSRFSQDGILLENPANDDLKK